jgi:hypothetical protein
MSNTVWLGLATLFWWLVVGVFLYIVLGSILFSVYAQYRFETTSGQVTESRLEEVPASGDSSATYRPIVAYRYSIEGSEYQGHRIFWTPVAEGWSWDVAKGILARYPIAAHVAVRYDPDNPQLAVLETDVLKYRAMQIFSLFPFVVIGMIMLVTCLRSQRTETSRQLRDKRRSVWPYRVFPTWFVAHALSIFALAVAGAYLPERAWFVWIGAVVVAAASLVAALPIQRLATLPRRRQTT